MILLCCAAAFGCDPSGPEAAPPVLDSVGPDSVILGIGPETLRLKGSGFTPAAVAGWRGHDLPTTYLGDAVLLAVVADAIKEPAGPGALTVRIGNLASGPAPVRAVYGRPSIREVLPTELAVGAVGDSISVFGGADGLAVLIDGDPVPARAVVRGQLGTALQAEVPVEAVLDARPVTIQLWDSVHDRVSDPVLVPARITRPNLYGVSPDHVGIRGATDFEVSGDRFAPGIQAVAGREDRPYEMAWDRMSYLPAQMMDHTRLSVTLPDSFVARTGAIQLQLVNPGFTTEGDELRSGGVRIATYDPVPIAPDPARLGGRCILDAGGAIQCWDPTPWPVAQGQSFSEIHEGQSGSLILGENRVYLACARATTGELFCWGKAHHGEAGAGDPTDRGQLYEPGDPVTGGTGLHAIAVGASHACGLDGTGSAWCWGGNGAGQLGTAAQLPLCADSNPDPDPPCAAEPVPVAGGLRFTELAAGDYFTCGLTETGAAWCWGSDASEALGNGPGHSGSPVPAPVDTPLRFAHIFAAAHAACATTAPGEAHCWGNNYNGALGIGTATQAQPVPAPMAGGHAFRALALGNEHGCGIDTAGQAHCWGSALAGALGNGEIDGWHPAPVPVSGGHVWAAITALGYQTTCGFTVGGDYMCWGRFSNPSGFAEPLDPCVASQWPGPCAPVPTHRAGTGS